MSVVVTFDFSAWKSIFPEFGNVTQAQAMQYFAEATIIQSNNGSWTNPISDPVIQLALLNILTAHIAYLRVGTTDNPAGQLVGRINSASEGSVNVGAEMDLPPGSPQWFAQTKYGAQWWQMTAQYRTMRYIPKFPRVFNPIFGARSGGGWPSF